MRNSLSILAIPLLLAFGCQPGAYLKATDSYAKATTDGLSALQGVQGLSSGLCNQRARFDYLFHRLNGPIVQGGKTIGWNDFQQNFTLSVKQANGTSTTQTWADHCGAIAKSDAVVANAMTVLGAYAKALQTVAEVDYSGADLKSVGTDTASLVGQLGAPSNATGVVTALSAPISSLAGKLEQAYAKGKVEEIVDQADADVATILTRLRDYLNAIQDESRDAPRALADLVALAESRMNQQAQAAGGASQTANPASILELDQMATKWKASLSKSSAALTAAGDAVTKLADAHKKLKAAKGKNDAPELKTVLGDIDTVLADVQAVETALAGTSGGT